MQAAPLAELPTRPAIAGTCLIALGLFALAPPDLIDPLQLDLRAFWAEPWRLLTSAVVHGGQLQGENWLTGLAHAGFNCYWLWLLGAGVEQRLGHLRTLGLIILFAVGGSLLEYAFTGPAVGLSGVVYGFVGLLAVLGRPHPNGLSNYRGLIDKRTVQFFVFWFGFCVVATITDVLPVANFAHAGGAGLGALVGWAMVEHGRHRKRELGLAITAIVVSLGLFVTGATVARPLINISARAGLDAMILAQQALAEDDLEQAIEWAERSVGYHRTPATYWHDLGVLYSAANRFDKARDALAEAVRRDPDNAQYQQMLAQFELFASASKPRQ